MYENISYSKKDSIAYIILNRPTALNAINSEMRKELTDAIADINKDSQVRVVIISGSGRAFCAGADLKEPLEKKKAWQGVRNYIDNLDKPIIAAIHGHCVGGGLQLALCCDIRIASEDAQFGLPESGMGIMVYYGGTQRLPRLVGTAKAVEMILTGRPIGSHEAYTFGLINRVVPKEYLMLVAEDIARSIAAKPPLLVKCCREAIYEGIQLPLNDALKLELDLASKANASAESK